MGLHPALDAQNANATPPTTSFIHFYNHHRSHGALGWATPTSTLRDNLPAEHT